MMLDKEDKEAIDIMANALYNLGMSVAEASKAFQQLSSAIMYSIHLLPNSRVKHLALHHKKPRVRKKNMRRLMEDRV